MKIDKRTLPKNQNTINKISKSKLEQSRSSILQSAQSFNQEQSNMQLAIPTHRKKKHITLEEYQDLLKQGKTVTDITKITSKHLVYFYNVLLRGKIKLTKEEFVKLYEEGKSLDEIAELHKILREHMTFLREFYGIKRKGATFHRRINNEKPLSQEAKDVIVGSLLGDGHVTKGGYFSEKHSEKQIEYLEWKGKALKEILTNKSFYYTKAYDNRYGSTNHSFCLRTITHSFLYELRNKFYKEIRGKWTKVIPNDMANMINEKVLAIWFMDDGYTGWGYRNGIKKYSNTKPQCKISSESFTLEENNILREILKSKFGLISTIRFKGDSKKFVKPFIKFNAESSVKLTKIVKPFATHDLLYKVTESEYLPHTSAIINEKVVVEQFIKRHEIISKTKNIKETVSISR